MPRIRVNDEFIDFCQDHFPPSQEDLSWVAELLSCDEREIERSLEFEPAGDVHETYDKEESYCAVCDLLLTGEDDKSDNVGGGEDAETENCGDELV